MNNEQEINKQFNKEHQVVFFVVDTDFLQTKLNDNKMENIKVTNYNELQFKTLEEVFS